MQNLTKEEKQALSKVREEIFKDYSSYEYRCAIKYLIKHRKEYSDKDAVKVALYDYLEKNHEKNKCWKNKL